jgi:hypothetical protein
VRRRPCEPGAKNQHGKGRDGGAVGTNLDDRNRQFDATARERAWIWNHDAEAEALKAAASL